MTEPNDFVTHLNQATALADKSAERLSEGDLYGAEVTATVSQAFSRLAQVELAQAVASPMTYLLPATGGMPPDLAQRIGEEVKRSTSR